MKEILRNPIIFTVVLSVLSVYFGILLSFLQKRKNFLVLEKVSIVFFLFLLSGPYAFKLRYLNPENFSYLFLPVDLSATQKLIKIAYICFYLAWLLVLRVRLNSIFRSAFHLFKDPFVGALLLLTLLSVTWSSSPLVTLIGALTLIAMAILASQLAIKYSWLELSRFLSISISVIGLLSLPVSLFLPSVGKVSEESWNGILLHKNPFGALMALGAVLWFFSLQKEEKHRKPKLALILILVFETFLSKSGGAISILIVLFITTLIHKVLTKLRNNQKHIYILFLIIGFLPMVYFGSEVNDFVLNLLGKDPNLTGRGDFWPQVVQAINERPILGYGYMGFWQPWRGVQSPSVHIRPPGTDFIPEQPHNGFLDVGTSLGYVGIAILLLSVLKNFIFIIKNISRSNNSEALVPLILLLYLLLRNYSETGLWRAGHDFFLYILLVVRLNWEATLSFRSSTSLIINRLSR